MVCFFKPKTAYEMRISDWSSDVCSSDLKLNLQLSADERLSLVFNDFRSPEALDPLGLTRAQFDEKPKQAAPQAEQYNTRKRIKQTQGGEIGRASCRAKVCQYV